MWKKQENKKKEKSEHLMKSKHKNQHLKKRSKHKKFILLTVVILLLVGIAGVCKYFLESFILRLEDTIKAFAAGTENGFPCEIEGDRVPSRDMTILNDNIVVVSDKFFESFNLFGNKISCRAHNFGNPVMKLGGSRALLYDIGGNNYSIESCSRNILKGDLKYKIICGDISENGTYGFITDSATYLADMTILNKNKTEKYKYNFVDFYVCDMAIKPDGTGVAVCGSSCENGEISSHIYIFNFDKKEPLLKYELPSEMVASLHYLSERHLAAVGDKAITFIDTKKNDKKAVPYYPKALKCIALEKNSGIVCSLGSICDGENDTLVSISKEGEIKFETEMEKAADKILTDKNKILCIQNKNLLIYESSGKFKNKISTENTPSAILKLSSSAVAVLENKTLKRVNIS